MINHDIQIHLNDADKYS